MDKQRQASAASTTTGPRAFRDGGSYSAPELKIYGAIVDMTRGTGSVKGDAGTKKPSDAALKENIVEIGKHSLGFGLYLFDYKREFRAAHGQQRQFGVMAQEVEMIVPEAVSMGADGYRRVDYGKLGIVPTVN